MQINSKTEPKLVTVIRQDLNFGYQLVQSCHSIADFAHEVPETFSKWKNESNSIICLSTKNQEDLLKLYEKYSTLTNCIKFFEPDVNEHTSICLYADDNIRKSLSNLPLALKNKLLK